MTTPVSPKRTALLNAARERILVLDGAMGTMIQNLQFDEAAFRGERFKDFHRDLRGNNDLLILTQPQAIEDIHAAYLRAGADIVATNTFSTTSIAQADYDLTDIVYEMAREGARLAGNAARRIEAEDGKPRFVAGAIGPTNRTASISPDVSNPGYRAVTFDDLRKSYGEQINGMLDGGCRSAAGRDHLRHAERQGGALCDRGNHRRARHRRARDGVGHHHRQIGPPAVGPDAGSVLEFGAARKTRHHRLQLRARCGRSARPHRRHRPRRRHLGVCLSERRPAQRIRSVRRDPGVHGAPGRRIRARWPRQHRRRLLRHHAGPYRGDCGGRRPAQAAYRAGNRTSLKGSPASSHSS
ncbi:hypothetical protein ACVWZR_002761 [Bradyrhizobium sp. i1.3.1]